jgi:hypothetical protein
LSKLPKATAKNPGGKKAYKRRWSNYLLNKKLQLRYVAFVTVLSAIICGALGYLIYNQANQASSRILDSAGELSEGDEDSKELYAAIDDRLKADDSGLIVKMSIIAVLLVVVLSLYLVVMTHKVAGPLYKVSNYFDKMAVGKLGEVWNLRKGDQLQDFYNAFKEMHDAVRKRAQEENEQVAAFLKACDDAGVSRKGELGDKLEVLEQYHTKREGALS